MYCTGVPIHYVLALLVSTERPLEQLVSSSDGEVIGDLKSSCSSGEPVYPVDDFPNEDVNL